MFDRNTGVSEPRLSPEMYGAVGNNVSLDHRALVNMSRALSRLGGGVVELYPGRTYLVGSQRLIRGNQASGYTYAPDDEYVLDFKGCTKLIVIRGNGATLKTAAGLKYGTFEDDGSPKASASGYMGGGISTPFYAMLRVTSCSGGAHIENLVLDGNSSKVVLGGNWGDNDRQIACSGIQLGHWMGTQNTCPIEISDVRSINHCLDGLVLYWPAATHDDPAYPVTLTKCAFDANARQGVSWVGGKGVRAVACSFNNTGKGAFSSAPKAGLDIEPEGGAVCEDGQFVNCEFINNAGAGVQGYGDPSFHHFAGCKFIGTTGPSVTGFGPYWVFDDCQFTGQLVNVYPSANPAAATKFNDCRLLFGVARSPTGEVYGPGGHMGDFGGQGCRNVVMKGCLLDGQDNTDIRLSYLSGITFIDCRLRQATEAGPGVAQWTTWIGLNAITAANGIDLYECDIRDTLEVNNVVAGRAIRRKKN